jgi:hypothetical protein
MTISTTQIWKKLDDFRIELSDLHSSARTLALLNRYDVRWL